MLSKISPKKNEKKLEPLRCSPRNSFKLSTHRIPTTPGLASTCPVLRWRGYQWFPIEVVNQLSRRLNRQNEINFWGDSMGIKMPKKKRSMTTRSQGLSHWSAESIGPGHFRHHGLAHPLDNPTFPFRSPLVLQPHAVQAPHGVETSILQKKKHPGAILCDLFGMVICDPFKG